MTYYRAYEGPNGWYAAAEADDGSHHQPDDGGHLTRQAAEAEALRLQDQSARLTSWMDRSRWSPVE